MFQPRGHCQVSLLKQQRKLICWYINNHLYQQKGLIPSRKVYVLYCSNFSQTDYPEAPMITLKLCKIILNSTLKIVN